MNIKHDKSYIKDIFWEFVRRGYADEDFHSIRFCYEYTEDEKNANRAYAETHTREEWSARCDEATQKRSAEMEPIMASLAKEFVCYQYEPDCGIPYGSNEWELFFWCNDFYQTTGGRYSGRDYSYFTLTFNSHMTVEQRRNVCKRVVAFLEKHYADKLHLNVVVQYTIAMNDQKIERDAKAVTPSLVGQKCTCSGMDGKIIETVSGVFFVKKYAKKNAYSLSDADILLISWNIA